MKKSSRKSPQLYTLLNKDGREVQIDLNNYKVTCTITGARKSFYHKYLHNLIQTKYAGNIDLFRDTYISRAGRPVTSKQDRLKIRIDRLRTKLKQLEQHAAELVN